MRQPINTVLQMGAMVAPFGGRNIAEDVEDLGFGELVRDVNNVAHPLRIPDSDDKYRVSYSCSDDWALPGFAGLKRHDIVTLHMIKHWSMPFAPGQTQVNLRRPAVEDNIEVIRADGTIVPEAQWNHTSAATVTLMGQALGGIVRFRPILTAFLDRASWDGNEWAGTVGWRADFVER